METVHGTHKASKLASEDVFGNMPDNVITSIMNRLPLRDAVRTGILARNWRLKWTQLTQLNIDCEMSQHFVTLGQEGKRYYNSRIISRLLLALKGPVTKFVLYIQSDQMLDVGDLNHWVLFLSRKGIKELTLLNLYHMPLTLPIHLFSCLELTHLRLGNCWLHPSPTFSGFPKLLSLDLHVVHFEIGKCGEFITRCPLLEIMRIVTDYRRYPLSKFNLDDIAKLENLMKLTLSLREIENKAITISSFFQFLGFLPKLEELNLDFLRCEFVAEGVAIKWVPSVFPCLHTLTLDAIDFGSRSMLSCVLRMIWGSPNLQELRISGSTLIGAYEFEDPPTALFGSDLGSNTLGQLQIQSLEMKYFRGLKNEVCLIKYLLACSPSLKRIAIYSSLSLVSDEKLKVAVELLKLHRAYTAQVDFY